MIRCLLLLLVACALVACANCPDPTSYDAQVQNAANAAAYAGCQRLAGPLCGAAPAPAGSSDDPNCKGGADEDPVNPPDALNTSACLYTGDDACIACVLGSCCAESVTCFSPPGDTTCACNFAQITKGLSWPSSSTCPAPDEAFAEERACIASAKCDDVCGIGGSP